MIKKYIYEKINVTTIYWKMHIYIMIQIIAKLDEVFCYILNMS
jgi:hypothetical protein